MVYVSHEPRIGYFFHKYYNFFFSRHNTLKMPLFWNPRLLVNNFIFFSTGYQLFPLNDFTYLISRWNCEKENQVEISMSYYFLQKEINSEKNNNC